MKSKIKQFTLMNNLNVFNKRLILPDRIQLTIYPKWNSTNKEFEKNHVAFGKGFPIVKRGKKKYVNIKDSTIPKYISDVNISVDQPYNVLLSFNFIRFFKGYLERYYPMFYDTKYDLSIRLNDDNYINNEICNCWNSIDYNNCIGMVKDICIRIAENCAETVYGENNNIEYQKMAIRQLEINQDYFVGNNKSLDVIRKLKKFLYSDSGEVWIIDKVRPIGFKSYDTIKEEKIKDKIDQDLITSKENHQKGLYSYQFRMKDGLYCKIYRKTLDHLRLELIYYYRILTKMNINKTFSGRQSKSRTWNNLDYIYRESKKLISRIDFLDILNQVDKPNYTMLFERKSEKYHELIGYTDPKLYEIYDAMNYNTLVTSKQGKDCFKRYPGLRKLFIKISLGETLYGYQYNRELGCKEFEKRKMEKEIFKSCMEKKDLRHLN